MEHMLQRPTDFESACWGFESLRVRLKNPNIQRFVVVGRYGERISTTYSGQILCRMD